MSAFSNNYLMNIEKPKIKNKNRQNKKYKMEDEDKNHASQTNISNNQNSSENDTNKQFDDKNSDEFRPNENQQKIKINEQKLKDAKEKTMEIKSDSNKDQNIAEEINQKNTNNLYLHENRYYFKNDFNKIHNPRQIRRSVPTCSPPGTYRTTKQRISPIMNFVNSGERSAAKFVTFRYNRTAAITRMIVKIFDRSAEPTAPERKRIRIIRITVQMTRSGMRPPFPFL